MNVYELVIASPSRNRRERFVVRAAWEDRAIEIAKKYFVAKYGLGRPTVRSEDCCLIEGNVKLQMQNTPGREDILAGYPAGVYKRDL